MPEILEFDSEWFGHRVGRCDGDPLRADEWGHDNQIDCLYCLVPLHKIAAVHDAARLGFRLVDVRVEFAAPTRSAEVDVRPATYEDKEAAQVLASTAFQRTRFHNDRRFDRARVNAMYANWVLTSVAQTLVIDAEMGVKGFVTVGATHLELIAVEPAYRGHGYGRCLAEAALAHAHANGRPELRVVTQGGNHAAQRTFQSVGFELVDTSLWLHKWYR